MLTTVEIWKNDGGVLTLPIYNSTNYQIRDIEGLDPVKTNIVTSNFSQMDGVQYQSSRRETRNIVMKIGLVLTSSTENIKDLRTNLYSYLLPKTDIKLKFIYSDATVYVINGHVESFDSSMFVKDPEASISIMCFDPDFYLETEITKSGTSVLSNSTTYNQITYNGNIDTGFVFQLTADTSINTITIENTPQDNILRKMLIEDTTGLLISGDILKISTVPGNKYVTRTRSGVETSILWALDRTSDWIKLYPGLNKVQLKMSIAGKTYTIKYTEKYGGL